ncbi:DEAD/DEAH box helicase [Corynebacterium doosanense]|uniref:ATP-dependent RNA helicase DeaD n=1 Tax=Corynebacterium doosanense CAU 212 = DSM 45436 TaxID=558173 RepID=A0A097IFB1_9CORY|nr:DEAD/DEAH box helicase [Corynebacterium doosanense]AIT60809.1 DEAD/DEAH box helicase [Corynebacterium doosanense CAU 212 = DSM 45436]
MSDIENAAGGENRPDDNYTSDIQNNSQGDAAQAAPVTEKFVVDSSTRDASGTENADSENNNLDIDNNVNNQNDNAGTTDQVGNNPAITRDADAAAISNPDDMVGGAINLAQLNDQQDTPVFAQAAPEAEPAKEKKSEPAEPAKAAKEEEPVSGFDNLGLPADVLKAIKKVGFEQPSPIQEQTIPLLMEGRDVVGLAQTGTGKTAAFALPILARLDTKVRAPQALVLAPTRELALQSADSFQSFADHLGGIQILPIYGGQAYGIQLSGLRRGAQIIVGTPGRVIDHLQKGSLDISNLKYLVLDEADEMLNMGFQEDVERILEDTPDSKQVALFSATMPNGIRKISRQYLNDPIEVQVKTETRTATNITQSYIYTAHRNKLDAITRILEVTEFEGMIVFVRTKHETEELAEKLRARGFSAAAINGDIAQNQRERTVDQLKDGRLDILVATDVAARGLDVDRISHVLNYDIPNDTESYVHRIGRTGRAGRKGEAILFVTPRERRMLRAIERATNATLYEMELPTVDEVNESRKEQFQDSITEAMESKQINVFRNMVRAYSQEKDVPMEDIAAALAAKAQGDEHFLMKEQPAQRQDRFDRDDRRGGRDDRRDDRRGGRDNERGGRDRDRGGARRPDGDFDTYRLAVGKRQNVRPGAIVGALANEGGLNSRDFGRITIAVDHTLVELPKSLDSGVLGRLSGTRISGQLINIERDHSGPHEGGPRGGGGRDRDDRRGGGFGGRSGGRDRDDRRGGGHDRDDRRGGGRGGWRD